MTKKKPKKTNYMKQADALFSRYIRERDGSCVACGSTEFLQCAHIISRSYKFIRTDERNAVALCRSCHMKFTHKPLEWEDFIESRWPGLWPTLRDKALEYERVNWRAERDRLKSLVEGLEAA